MIAAGKTWASLSLYESAELVRRLAKEKTGREPNASRALNVAAHFSQGREYFRSAAGAGEMVRPLILYYGAMSLARGAVLFLEPRRNEIRGGHGLKGQGWSDLVKDPRSVPDLPVRVESDGTFPELARLTANSDTARVPNAGVPGEVVVRSPGTGLQTGARLSLQEVLGQILEMTDSYAQFEGVMDQAAQDAGVQDVMEEEAQEARQTADEATGQGQEPVEQAAGQAQEMAGDAAGQAQDAAGEVAEQVQDTAGQATEQAEEAAGQATDQAGEVANRAQDTARKATKQAQDTVGGLTG